MQLNDEIVVRFGTTEQITIKDGRWTRVRGLAALAISEKHGYTVERFESLEELGQWLDRQGYQWIAESRGHYKRFPERLAA